MNDSRPPALDRTTYQAIFQRAQILRRRRTTMIASVTGAVIGLVCLTGITVAVSGGEASTTYTGTTQAIEVPVGHSGTDLIVESIEARRSISCAGNLYRVALDIKNIGTEEVMIRELTLVGSVSIPFPIDPSTRLDPGERISSALHLPGSTTGPISYRLVTNNGGSTSGLPEVNGSCS